MNIGLLHVHRLCVFASGSCITSILLCIMLTKLSFLHLGQYRGKFSNTVSCLTLILVFPQQTGQRIHSDSIFCARAILLLSLSIVLLCPFSPLVKALIQKDKRTNPMRFVLLPLYVPSIPFNDKYMLPCGVLKYAQPAVTHLGI